MVLRLASRLSQPRLTLFFPLRLFTTTTTLYKKSLPPRPKPPPDSEIEEFYLKGSGPGGQKINKTNSAVQLRHIPTGLVVKSQATRSRDQNRKHARELLAQKVDELRNGDQSRSAIVGRIKQKRAASADKKKRRKYKKLDEEPGSAEEQEEGHGEAAEDGEGDEHLSPGKGEEEEEGAEPSAGQETKESPPTSAATDGSKP